MSDVSEPCETCHRSREVKYLCDINGCGNECSAPNGGPTAKIVMNSLDCVTSAHLCGSCFNKVVSLLSVKLTVDYISNEN